MSVVLPSDHSWGGVAKAPRNSRHQSEYLLENRICLLGNGLVENWTCFFDWIRPQAGPDTSCLAINWDHLEEAYGDHTVIVADCRTRHHSDQRRETMTLARALRILRDVESHKLLETCPMESIDQSGQDPLPYIKDWHLVLQSRHRTPYSVPSIFVDDCAFISRPLSEMYLLLGLRIGTLLLRGPFHLLASSAEGTPCRAEQCANWGRRFPLLLLWSRGNVYTTSS